MYEADSVKIEDMKMSPSPKNEEKIGMGEKIIVNRLSTKTAVIIGENNKLVNGETIDISPKQSHEKTQVENTAPRVNKIETVRVISTRT